MAAVNVVAYVGELTHDKRDKLWDSPWTCQAVLRSLPELAKHYVMRMLFIGDIPVPAEVMAQWVRDRKAHGPQHKQALESLRGLGLLVEATGQGSRLALTLHPRFCANIQWALSGRAQAVHDLPAEVLEAVPSQQQLDEHAHTQWEALQLYILSSSQDPPAMPPGVPSEPLDVHRLLQGAHLVQGTARDRAITDDGFRFLLNDSYRQLWHFLTHYIRDAEFRSGAELSSVMSFLMQLGFMRVGQPYPFEGLQGMERDIAGHMAQLGLLLPFAPCGTAAYGGQGLYFCPTRLAASLCSGFDAGPKGGGAAALATNADIAGGHIIVESNYRVYGYTSSPVTIAILEIFTRRECVLPNMYVGALTRDKVLKAVKDGITAQDIIDFLQHHAHPVSLRRNHFVPEVVVDQIRLWEGETRRVQADTAVLYEQFECPELYTVSRDFAQQQGFLVWCSDAQAQFAAKDAGHDRIKDFIKDQKQKMASQGLF